MTTAADRWQIYVLRESIHAVISLERELLNAAVPCDLRPTPRDLHTDCGMCVTLRPEDLPAAQSILHRLRAGTIGCYRRTASGFEPIDPPMPEAGG